jgi:exodeoxyribonuclease V alpha subunit
MKNSELIGVFLGADFVFDNGPDRRCVVGSVRLLDKSRVTVRGYANEAELSENVTYRFYGHNRNHPKYGTQFNFNSFVEEQPADEDSIIAYLETCRKPERGSFTRRVALALFEAFGVTAIERLKADPVGAAATVKQWDAAKAALAAQYLSAQAGTQSCKLDLITLLNGRGFPKKTIDRAIKLWGAAAARVVRQDPYELTKLAGIGFKGADKLYCDLTRQEAKSDEEYQMALAAIHRQGLCAAYAVSSESRQSGSTWLPIGFAKAAVLSNVSRIHATPDKAIDWAISEGKLVVRDGFVAVARMSLHELEIAEFVSGSDAGDLCQSSVWPSIDEVKLMAPADKLLSSHQGEAIDHATAVRVGCLQGSPGVGKTFCVAAIVKAVIARFGRDSIAVCAPTGKAAVRVAQSMLANGVDLPASTIHRLLQVEGEGGDGWSFHFNEQNPLPFRFLIIDESSMIDVDLLASLLRACTPSTHILFVGDTGQLAPVGHGRPFFDLQQCVPTGKLTEIRRNSGRIVKACAEIRDRNSITFSEKLDIDNGENLILIQCSDEDQPKILEQLIAKIDAQHIVPRNLSVIDDLQILTGKNDGSPVARKPLNKMLQQVLNPDGERIQGNPFRVNDKIVDLKNGKYPDAEDQNEEHFVANGELAKAKDIKPGRIVVEVADPKRSILICHAPVQENENGIDDSENTAKGAVGDWDLGYALSVHRSQGSQWKFAIVMVDSKGQMVQSRNWLFTAISRAEIATFVIGQKQVVNAMLKRDGISGRKTFLVERIRHQRAVATVDYDALFAEV